MVVKQSRNNIRIIGLLALVGFSQLVYATESELANTPITFNETEIAQIISHGPWPTDVPPDPGNELSGLSWAEVLGERLFSDPSLSGSSTISCATCHHKTSGFADGLAVAQGADEHVRNTQGLLDIGLQRWFGWDGGADSLWAAALRPMLSPIEMDGTVKKIANELRSNNAFVRSMKEGVSLSDNKIPFSEDMDDEALVVIAAKAMGAYSRTLQSDSTAFDKFRLALLNKDETTQAQYPDSAKRGLKIFLGEANCHVCHFGSNFSNGEFHDTGRPFFVAVGKVDPGRYTGIKRVQSDPYNLLGKYNRVGDSNAKLKTANVIHNQTNWGQWRTPSLRNLRSTAPYMHDGSLPDLRSVVDAYADLDSDRLHAKGESLLKPLPLDDKAREDLVTFLQTLSP